jgi:two-component system chemotaxis response regulator CheY
LGVKFSYPDIHVLVIDDHGHIRKAMMKLLRHAGAKNVEEASNGAQAIRYMDENQVDLVLCDIYMPKADGFDVLSYIRSKDIKNDIPVVMVSGEANRADIVKATEMGATEYILKPFKKDEFIEKIDKTVVSYYNPNEQVKLLRKAENLLDAKDPKLALEAAKEAFQQDPMSQRARHILALSLAELSQPDEALKLLDQGIEADPEHYRYYATKANLLFKMKRDREALEAMAQELELNPKQAKRQVMMAMYQSKTGNPKAAIEHFREALKEKPKHKQGLLGMANAYFQNNDLDKTIYYLQRYRRQHPTDSKSLMAIVKYCKLVNEDKKAEHAIKSEINNHPERFDAYIVLAMFHVSKEHTDKALKVLDLLFSKDPDNVEGLRLRGNIFFEQKKYIECEKDYKKASKLSPSLDTLVPLAKARLKLKKPKAFYSACERAFMFGSSNAEVVSLMAQAYLATGQPTQAYFMARKAILLGAKGNQIKKLAKTAYASIPRTRRSTKTVAS